MAQGVEVFQMIADICGKMGQFEEIENLDLLTINLILVRFHVEYLSRSRPQFKYIWRF